MLAVAFREQLDPEYFPVEFNDNNFRIIDFDQRNQYIPDFYFQINVNKPNSQYAHIYDFIDSTCKPKLVCESTPFRRNGYQGDKDNWYYRLGWNHFLRCGTFNNTNSNNARWQMIQQDQGIQLKPWRNQGEGILIILQKSGDATLNSMYARFGTYDRWLFETIAQIRNYTRERIVIRPHIGTSKSVYTKALKQPLVELSGVWQDRTTIFEGGASLQQDLDGIRAVVGYNSNALVESICDGIPTIVLDKDAVTYPVRTRLEDINNPDLTIDRTQWLNDLSYCCWRLSEIRNGTAYEHIKSVQPTNGMLLGH